MHEHTRACAAYEHICQSVYLSVFARVFVYVHVHARACMCACVRMREHRCARYS